MRQCPPDALGLGFGAHVLRKNLRIVQQLLQPLDAVENFDQPRLMVVERTEHGRALQFVELRQFLVGALGSAAVDHVKPRQRSDAVHAVGISLGLVVRGFQVAPAFDLFTEVVEVAGRVQTVGDEIAGCVADAKLAVVEGDASVFLDHAHEERRKIAEAADLLAKCLA